MGMDLWLFVMMWIRTVSIQSLYVNDVRFALQLRSGVFTTSTASRVCPLAAAAAALVVAPTSTSEDEVSITADSITSISGIPTKFSESSSAAETRSQTCSATVRQHFFALPYRMIAISL